MISENQSHIRELFVSFLATITRDEAYHGLQKRGSNTGAIRSPDEVMQDPHLEDREFFVEVEHLFDNGVMLLASANRTERDFDYLLNYTVSPIDPVTGESTRWALASRTSSSVGGSTSQKVKVKSKGVCEIAQKFA